MSIATEIARLQNAKVDLKTSINAKNDSEHQITTETIDDYADFVDSIETGGGSATLQTKSVTISTNTTTTISPDEGYDGMSSVNVTTLVPIPGVSVSGKDVNFYDYDGVRLYAYTKNEFLALESLPANPTHTGLTAQGWNWTLADAKTFVTNNDKLDIGQMYITSDGKTRIYIELTEGRLSPIFTIGFSGSGSVNVDWGDSTSETLSANNTSASKKHTYPTASNYVITIEPVGNSSLIFVGNNISFSRILNYSSNPGNSNEPHVYQNTIKKIEIGSNFHVSNGIGLYAFGNCQNLETITIPKYLTRIWGQAFQSCYSLKALVIPNEVTIVDGNAFENCSSLKHIIFPNTITTWSVNMVAYARMLESVVVPTGYTSMPQQLFDGCTTLKYITIPEGITTIGRYAIRSCYSLAKIKFPSTLTSITQQAFIYDYGMIEYDFSKCEAIPTLQNSNAFTGIPTGCKIIVPDALYETWITESGWSTYASYIVKKSEI